MTAQPLESRYRVTGMDCASCGRKIDTAIRRLPGVEDVSVAVQTGVLKIRHGGDLADEAVLQQLRNLGYIGEAAAPTSGAVAAAAGPPPAAARAGGAPWWWTGKARLTALCGLALLSAYGLGTLFPSLERYAFLAALAVGLIPIASRAFSAARHGTPFSIEMLMTIAAVGAVFIGAAEEAAAVVLLFLVGEMLEGVAAGRARKSIQGLAALVPKTAFVEADGVTTEVAAETVAVGAIILVRPGDRVPADGEIIEGAGDLDEAPVTGESVPRRKVVGDPVFAGTINGGSVLRVRVTASASDNTIARVVRLVEEAQESKSPTERFIDRFSKIYTPGVLVFAALVAVTPPLLFGGTWSEWIYKGLAVLLIGCPCALVISTPAAIAAGLSAGARRGLLMKGGAVLETLGKITAIAFDKTGTLTAGKPVVTDVVAGTRDASLLLTLAAALETGSSHPLALAILARAEADKITAPPSSATQAIAGEGVEGEVGGERIFLGSPLAAARRAPITPAQDATIAALNAEGKTVSVLVVEEGVAGFLAMRDEARPDAVQGLADLKGRGIRTVMLTGDNRRTAEAVAAALGLEPRAELLPQDKLVIVKALQAEGLVVAKVGDGINDAPALARADIGFAMGAAGTGTAIETADVALMDDDLRKIGTFLRLSRATHSVLIQNIALALGIKAVFLTLAMTGNATLWMAVFADVGASLLVVANGLRLLRAAPQTA